MLQIAAGRTSTGPHAGLPPEPGHSPGLCGRLRLVRGGSTANRGTRPESRARTDEFGTDPRPPRERSNADDGALARAAIVGQAWAQREMWYRFAPMVYAFLRRTLGTAHDHEDLLQEVFLRVFHRLSTLQNLGSLRSFVFSFAIRIVREEIRRHRIRTRLAGLFASPKGEAWVPHMDFESRELLRRAQVALDSMPGRKRAVFVLRRFEGLELADIANHLELSIATVKRDLEKANDHIAKTIHRDQQLRTGLEASLTATAAPPPAARGKADEP
jgi:RNA polymerase sigma-70 factor, ECF subfamily